MGSKAWRLGATAVLTLCWGVSPGADRALAAADADNGRIALVDTIRGNTDIYTIRPDGTGRHRLTTDAGLDTDPSYSADGRLLTFVKSTSATTTRPTELWVMNADGSRRRRLLTVADGVSCPDFSPDGRQLAFTRLGGMSSGQQGIWTLAPATGIARRLAPPTPGFESCPAWSPDGTTLAFTRWDGSETDGPRVWTMRANGSHRQQLTKMGAQEQESDATPDWSPDGRYLLFGREIDGSTDSWSTLWRVRANGSGLQQLTHTDAPGGFTGPAVFSPDGTRFAGFCNNRPASPATGE